MSGSRNLMLLVILAGFAVAGCKSAPRKSARSTYESDGNVSALKLQAPASESYEESPDTTYSGSRPVGKNAEPQYPAGLLSSELPPVSVTVKVIVDVEGAVTDAAVDDSQGIRQEFVHAALTAVRTWRFSPLKRTTAGKVEALPFSQQYRFVFRQVNGRAVVQAGEEIPRKK